MNNGYTTAEVVKLYQSGIEIKSIIKRVRHMCDISEQEAKQLVERDICNYLVELNRRAENG